MTKSIIMNFQPFRVVTTWSLLMASDPTAETETGMKHPWLDIKALILESLHKSHFSGHSHT